MLLELTDPDGGEGWKPMSNQTTIMRTRVSTWMYVHELFIMC